MLLFQIFGCLLPFVVGLRTQRSSGTLVDFTDPKVILSLIWKQKLISITLWIKFQSLFNLTVFGCISNKIVTSLISLSLLFYLSSPQVQGHLDALVRMAQSCVIKVRATPKDVRAYFTNSSPVSRSGQCFAACMLEQSDVINHGKVTKRLHISGNNSVLGVVDFHVFDFIIIFINIKNCRHIILRGN